MTDIDIQEDPIMLGWIAHYAEELRSMGYGADSGTSLLDRYNMAMTLKTEFGD